MVNKKQPLAFGLSVGFRHSTVCNHHAGWDRADQIHGTRVVSRTQFGKLENPHPLENAHSDGFSVWD